MKGLVIVGFTRSPGAFVDHETPENFCEENNITDEDLTNIFGLHRMRRMDPNFITLTLKKQTIASYYSGFNFKHYVGKPGFAVTLFLEPGENPNRYEDQLRQIAHELLPRKDEETLAEYVDNFGRTKTFQELLNEYFVDLEGDLLDGVDESVEVKEEGAGLLMKISKADEKPILAPISDDKAKEPPVAVTITEEDVAKQFEAIEEKSKDDQIAFLRNEIRKRDEEIANLEVYAAGNGHASVRVQELETELEDWKVKIAQIMEEKQIAEESIRRMTELDMMNADEMQNQARTIKKLRERVKTLEQELEGKGRDISLNDADDVATLEKHITDLEIKVTDLETKNNLLEEENVGLKDHLEKLEAINEQFEVLKEDHAHHSDRMEALEEELEAKEKEVKLLTDRITELTEQLSEKVEVTRDEAQEKEIQDLKGQIAKLGERAESVEQEKTKYEERIDALKQEVVEFKVQNKLHRREIEILKRRLGDG